MLKLVKVQVWKYKSIENSSPVEISEDVTVLVGKNEAGKTAFLEALHKALPLDGGVKFDYIADYPRKDLVRYRPQHAAGQHQRVVELTFEIGDELVEQINSEVFGGQKVIAVKAKFTHDTDHNNHDSIGFIIDEQKALKALKANLSGLEHVDEVFNGASNLEAVLSRIEEKTLAADNGLAVFAAEWKKRAVKGWNLPRGHIWLKYLSKALPKFLYFDDYSLLDGKINLQALHSRIGQNQRTEADRTAQGLLQLAGATIEELMSNEGYETAKAKLEAIGLDITRQVFDYWKQNQELDVEFDVKADQHDVAPFNSGLNLYIRIKNRRHGVTVPFDQRSKGFIWFFSFLVWFDAVQSRADTKEHLILLLDEPGLNLHALAQADLLGYIRELASKHQVIYTTHSPFMVDSPRLDEVRVVEDRPKEGTVISGNLASASDDSVFPLQAALGYSIAQNLFIGKKNILVEGPADLILLLHVGSLLEAAGETGLRDAIVVPVGGLDKLVTFVALLGANKLKLVVLHDKASSSPQKLDDLVKQKLIERKKVLDYSMFIDPSPSEADLEDLVPAQLYVGAFNAAYAKELGATTLLVSDLGAHPRMVERINQWLLAKGLVLLKEGGFNHYRVAQALLPTFTLGALAADEKAAFVRLFECAHEVL